MKSFKPVPSGVHMFASTMDMHRVIGYVQKGRGRVYKTRKLRTVFVLHLEGGAILRKVISMYPQMPQARCTYDFVKGRVLT